MDERDKWTTEQVEKAYRRIEDTDAPLKLILEQTIENAMSFADSQREERVAGLITACKELEEWLVEPPMLIGHSREQELEYKKAIKNFRQELLQASPLRTPK